MKLKQIFLGCVVTTMYGSTVVYIELIAEFVNELTETLSFCNWMVIAAVSVAPLTLLKTPKDFW